MTNENAKILNVFKEKLNVQYLLIKYHVFSKKIALVFHLTFLFIHKNKEEKNFIFPTQYDIF